MWPAIVPGLQIRQRRIVIRIEARLRQLGLGLPEPVQAPPGIRLPFAPVRQGRRARPLRRRHGRAAVQPPRGGRGGGPDHALTIPRLLGAAWADGERMPRYPARRRMAAELAGPSRPGLPRRILGRLPVSAAAA